MGQLESIAAMFDRYLSNFKDDTGLSDQLKELSQYIHNIDEKYTDMLSILSYFQDKSNKGLIREIPVCPGDICYVVDDSEGVIDRQIKVDHIEINADGIDIWLDEDSGSYSCFTASDFGDILFTDYDEAQKRCQEIQSKLSPKIAK